MNRKGFLSKSTVYALSLTLLLLNTSPTFVAAQGPQQGPQEEEGWVGGVSKALDAVFRSYQEAQRAHSRPSFRPLVSIRRPHIIILQTSSFPGVRFPVRRRIFPTMFARILSFLKTWAWPNSYLNF